jgi:hypothetical protein
MTTVSALDRVATVFGSRPLAERNFSSKNVESNVTLSLRNVQFPQMVFKNSSTITENTQRLRFKDQMVNAVGGGRELFILRIISNTQIQSGCGGRARSTTVF